MIINITDNTLTLYEDNIYLKTYSIALGKEATPTPLGRFKIANKHRNPGGPYGVRWMGLSKRHYGIHGTNKPDSIGKDVSRGCIRLSNEDAIEVYDLVSIGSIVDIMEG